MLERHLPNLADPNAIVRTLMAAMRPDPSEPIVDWVLENRSLSSSVTALPGPMNIARHTPYMTEIYEAAHPRSGVTEIAIKKCTQVSYSELVLSVSAYYAVKSPCPAMIVQPSDEDIKLFVQQRLDDLRNNTSAFRKVIETASEKAADNIHNIGFRGGFIRIVTARSSSQLSSMPVRLLILDEVDQYQDDVNGQGSPIGLAIRRQDTFGRRRKTILGGTPTIEDASAIDAAYKDGDQRRYHVPCPNCDGMQILDFRRLKWPRNQPLLAQYECEHCGFMIDERHKTDMLAKGKWVPSRESPRRSYWIHGMIRPIGSLGWGQMVEEWLRIGNDPARLKTFTNLVLGETYKETEVLEIRSGDLAQRSEDFGGKAPKGVRVVTAGVDVQASPPRFEVEIVGWGDGFESWSLGYYVIQGGIKSPQARQALLDLLATPIEAADGKRVRVSYTCMDSGNETTDVYAFCRDRAHSGILAVKGMASAGGAERPIWPLKATRIKKHQVTIRIIGIDQAKSDIYRFASLTEPGPGYMHTPSDRKQEWYDQLLSEIRTVKLVRGRAIHVWHLPQHRHNEALDCRVYAYAAAVGAVREAGLDLSRFKPIDHKAAVVQDASTTMPVPHPAPPAPKAVNPKPKPKQARHPQTQKWAAASWGQKRW